MFPGHVLGGEGLVGKAHVHDTGWMPLCSGQIDQTALAEEVDPSSALQGEFLDKFPDLSPVGCGLL